MGPLCHEENRGIGIQLNWEERREGEKEDERRGGEREELELWVNSHQIYSVYRTWSSKVQALTVTDASYWELCNCHQHLDSCESLFTYAFIHHLLWTVFIITVNIVVGYLINTPICKATSASKSVLCQPSRLLHTCSPSTHTRWCMPAIPAYTHYGACLQSQVLGTERHKDQKFKVLLSCIVSWRPAWSMWDPTSK